MPAKKAPAKPKADPTAGSTRFRYNGDEPLTIYAPHPGATVAIRKGDVIDTALLGDFVSGRPDLFTKVAKNANLTVLGGPGAVSAEEEGG